MKYVISLGNHWLQTDNHLTKVEWVSDLCKASFHSIEWCEDFVKNQNDNKHYVILKFDAAMELCRDELARRLKDRWLAVFEEEVGPYENKNGLWVNAHMYYSMNLPAKKAAKTFKASFSLK